MSKRIFFGILIIAFIGYIWLSSQVSGFANGQDKIFAIEKGQGVNEISRNLKEEGFIKNCFIFETFVWGKKIESKFQAMDMAKIAKKLTEGHVLSQEREIKIIEGWNSRDIADYLDNEGVAGKEEFLKIIGAEGWKDAFFGGEINLETAPVELKFLEIIPQSKGLEGFLFPDTYRVYKNADALDVIDKMLTNFGVKVDEKMRADIKAQNKDLYDIIIMASIIEKEVTSVSDMKIVSDIFWRRIEAGIPLQSCATVAYVLGKNKDQYTYDDTRVESEYNTYMNRGLPPGPICNPGLNAIGAAIYPEENSYWYFLSKSSNGETVFSKSLDEHNANKIKYLK